MNAVLNDALAALLLLVLFLSVIGLAELSIRKGWLTAEPARKLIHVAGGLGCLLFPYLIASWITVLGLAITLSATLHFGEHRGVLRSLSSVGRKSYGSLLFPVSILFLFIVSNGRIWLYVSSLLVLVLADTAAALAGTRFGCICYDTIPGQKKSLEGTLMFALVGFFSVYLSLLALSDIPHPTCILTALLMAMLLAVLEAVSIGGTDNLFVPVGTCFLLLKIPTKPPAEILFQCLSFVGIAVLIFLINQRTKTFRSRTLLIFILACYSSWALGSVEWTVPVAVGFILYNWICTPCAPLPAELTARQMLRPMYPMLIILFAANAFWAFEFWFTPYMVATATSSSLCIESRYRRDRRLENLRGSRLLATLLLPSVIILLLCLPMHGSAVFAIAPLVVPLCAAVPLVYLYCKRSTTEGFPWSYAITIHAAAAALIYAGFEHFGFVQTLTPLTWMEVFR